MRAALTVMIFLMFASTGVRAEELLNETFSDPGQFPSMWNVLSGTVAVEDGWAHGHASGEDDPIFVLRDPAALRWTNITMDVDTRWTSNESYSYCRIFFYLQSTTAWQPNLYPPNGYMLDMKVQQQNIVLSRFVGGSGETLSLLYYPVAAGVTYHVQIAVANGDISVAINGQTAMQVHDDTFPSGTIGFSASTGGGSWTYIDSYYDNVFVSGNLLPGRGACCFQAGICLLGTEADCTAVGGSYMGDGTTCEQTPCQPTPVECATWGQVRGAFR